MFNILFGIPNTKMPTYGKLESYDETEDWGQYVERLEHYFSANEIDDGGKKRDIFLSVCGQRTYKLIRDLVAPGKPGDKTFTALTKLVKDHKQPEPSEIIQRFKFNSRIRHSDESVRAYVAALRSLTEHCNYGETLNAMLRDRLVVGIKNDRIQRRLLAEPALTFDKALEIATAMETAEKNAQDIQASGNSTTLRNTVNKVFKSSKSKPKFVSSGKSHSKDCYRCGGDHAPFDCKFKNAKCHNCKKKGHIAKKCRNSEFRGKKPEFKRKQAHYVEESDENSDSESDVYSVFHVGNYKSDPYKINVNVNSKDITMELDTGASVSLMSEDTYQEYKSKFKLEYTNVKLRTYLGDLIPVLGRATVHVQYGKENMELPLIVVKRKGPNLLGRDWLSKLQLNWKEIFSVTEQESNSVNLESLLSTYREVFKDELGTIQGVKAKIYVDENAPPKYFKARPVPYALKEKIELELDRLEKQGQITRVQFSEWAAPIVPVVKEKGIRICGDYKVTVNRVSKLDNYPIPKTEDLYATLSGGEEYTKLDLTQAYQQIELDEDSKRYTTINTHKGLYQYNRLPFGISSSPGIFQRTLENILQGIPNVLIRVDDILITGRNRTEHLKTLNEVLSRFKKTGVRLNRQKCTFLANEVVYLGYNISKKGIKPVNSKVKAITEAPSPTNITELKAYLGMLNYYNRFLPNLSTLLQPLHDLLKKNTKWQWGQKQETAFQESKKLLTSASVLIHFDPQKPLVMTCDASPYGIGAVLSHKTDRGEQPIAYVSRTLTSAEKNYSVLEKESLAIIFGIKKFHQYIYGHRVQIITDHKPLIGLFREDKAIPTMAASRIQRWALTLAAYEYEIMYRVGSKNNADGLSRLPLEAKEISVPTPGDILLLIEHLDTTPVNAKSIQKWTRKDNLLSTVLRYILHGWPSKCPSDDMQPYFNRRNELSTQDGCILWGGRVVIPHQGRESMLSEIHQGHPGINRMKSLARSYVWWPGLDKDLEKTVFNCQSCQENRKLPAEAPWHPWEYPSRPWSRLHLDFAGPFMNKMFLIIVDAYSKWIDVSVMNSTTSESTIAKLEQVFATHGLCDMIVTDNGSAFTSAEFAAFVHKYGIKHRTTAPWHPSSNGCAERAVQNFKEGMKKIKSGSIQEKLNRFLFRYRITPQTTTGLAPCELLMKRKLKSRLDLVFPNIEEKVVEKQSKQKEHHDKTSKRRIIKVGDSVFAKNFSLNSQLKWIKGTIKNQTGPLSFKIELQDGRMIRRHIDHIRIRSSECDDAEDNKDISDLSLNDDFGVPLFEITPPQNNDNQCSGQTTDKTPTTELTPRYPKRVRKEPSYLKDYVRK